MKDKPKGYFLLIDPQMNSLRIPCNDEWLLDEVVKNNDKIRRHKTKKELTAEINDYLKGGGKNEG